MRVCEFYHLHSMPDSFFTIKPILRLRHEAKNKHCNVSGADEPSIYDLKHLSITIKATIKLVSVEKSWWSLADSNR